MPTSERALMTNGNGGGPDGFDDVIAIALPANLDAPGAARLVINACVAPLVAPTVLADAVLLASELVSNGVVHAGLGDRDTLQIRIRLSKSTLRLEVENPGLKGEVAAREPDTEKPTGFGLDLTSLLSARWGVERGSDTSVWAELATG
jgi:anti-sigma regulatory factor (Ser/Thr protein kinase)